MNLLYVTNGAAVGIFGMVLSGAFCDIHWTKEKREFLVGSIFVLLAIQGVMYLLAGAATIRYLYPVITHVPMCIALYILTKKRLWTVISRADCLSLLSASQVGGTFYNGCVCEQ